MITRNGYDPEACGAMCRQCPLYGHAVVPPEGPADPELVLIGEAPGFQEVKQLRPFVGPSGAALAEICATLGIRRERVHVTNAILCRPQVPGEDGKKSFEVKRYIAWIRKENNLRRRAAKAAGTVPELISDPFDCCAPRLWIELGHAERVAQKRGQPNGAVVMPLGNFALFSLTSERGIMKFRGSPLKMDVFGGGS